MLMHRLLARLWHMLSGRVQWRVARIRHRTFLVYVAGIVRDDQGRVLLLRHRLWPQYRAWGLPGGYVNAGERLEDAVAREIQEETALEVAVKGPPLHLASGFRWRVEAYYEATVTGGRIDLETAEILEARWFALDDLPTGMSVPVRRWLSTLDEQH
ncbi:NUDIX domain-containing protein [Actinomadura fibrosa]|uniref:NUDIX domain-containing protein n=1 Tax=Actinomadura fibrosa TaxID=111802 RepID=A0ABW2XHF7_9ACTN|nr:NUDIX domain-containing protein [Actinomadura fibrosa]